MKKADNRLGELCVIIGNLTFKFVGMGNAAIMARAITKSKVVTHRPLTGIAPKQWQSTERYPKTSETKNRQQKSAVVNICEDTSRKFVKM
jgi:hypothetical protein